MQAVDRLRAESANQVEVQGTTYQICRARRLLRWGPAGPEGPRPSDTSRYPPGSIHPWLDVDDNIHYDHEDEDED